MADLLFKNIYYMTYIWNRMQFPARNMSIFFFHIIYIYTVFKTDSVQVIIAASTQIFTVRHKAF